MPLKTLLQEQLQLKQLKTETLQLFLNKDFENIIGEAVKKDFESKTTVLINIPAFKHLTRKTLEKLTFYMKEIKLCKDSILFKEGDQTDGLYLIKDGEFEITKRYKRSLKEKHKTQAFPIKIKKEIRCCTLSKNEALGLDFIIGRRSYRQY